MLKKTFIILLVVGIKAFCFSNNSDKDSLLRIANSRVNDSVKTRAYYLLGNNASANEKKDALLYFSTAEKLALQLKNKYLLGQTYYYKSRFFVEKLQNYSSGLMYIDKAIECFFGTKYYHELMYSYLFKGRNIYEALDMDKEAIEAIRKSTYAAENINSESHASQLYVLAWFETNNGMPDSAIQHFNKCYNIETNRLKIDYHFAVELLIWTGNAYRRKHDYRTALRYQYRAVALSDSIKFEWGKYSAYRYIAYNYHDNLHKLDSAIYYLTQTENYYINLRDPLGAHYIGTDMIRYLLEANRLSDADRYVQRLTDSTFINLVTNDETKIRFYKILFDYYKAKGNYKKAMSSLYNYNVLKDSADAVKQRANLGEQSSKHEIQLLKEQQKSEQQKKDFMLQRKLIEQRFFSYIMLTVIFISLILLVIAFAIIRQKKRTNKKISSQKLEVEKQKTLVEAKNVELNQKKAEIEMNLKEKEVLLREIHHRVKNNLQIISGLMVHQLSCITDEVMRANCITIKNKINAIGLIHENFYQSKNLAYIDMQLYVSRLTKNILALSNITDIKTFFVIKEVIFDIDTATPLGLIINELITNSIKHAFAGLSTKEIKIQLFETSQGCYELIYSDSGVGYQSVKTKKRLGLNLIDLLTNQLNGKNRIEYGETWKMILDFENTSKRKEKD
jgi:two-component sensor histidine kinase